MSCNERLPTTICRKHMEMARLHIFNVLEAVFVGHIYVINPFNREALNGLFAPPPAPD
jgi:hypothetical protein